MTTSHDNPYWSTAMTTPILRSRAQRRPHTIQKRERLLAMRFPFPALIFGALTLPVAAQDALQHYDGTTEATGRGFGGALAAKTVMQRIPIDEACGRARVVDVVVALQDQNNATVEPWSIEIRATDPAGPPTGAPDMSPAGLLTVAGPFAPTFPGAGPISAAVFTVGIPLLLVPLVPNAPSNDIYVGVAHAYQPLWPADGTSTWTSGAFAPAPGEQMRATAVGYTGVAGLAGLAWEGPAGGPPSLSSANKAWNIRTRFADDTLQPFASNAAVFTGAGGAGANPNFGYAGIFPDLVRGDMIGWRALSTAAVGDLVFLFLGSPSPPGALPAAEALPSLPFAPVGPGGQLCILPPWSGVGLAVYAAAPGEPATTVKASWGPYVIPAVFAGTTLFAQAVSIKTGVPVWELTTSCKTSM
jgi:hypothetical protein